MLGTQQSPEAQDSLAQYHNFMPDVKNSFNIQLNGFP